MLLFDEVVTLTCHCVCCGVSGIEDPRISAEEMDVQRQENIAYEYLCHLEEAKVYVWTFFPVLVA